MNVVLITLSTAVLFGILYNWLVGWLEERRYAEGEASLLVVIGVLVTLLLSVPLVGWKNAGLILLVFVLTGIPMIVGAKYRQHKDLVKAREELARTVECHDQEEDRRV